MHRLIFFTVFLILSGSILPWNASGGSGTLEIVATGFSNPKGAARIALVNSAENWEAREPFRGFICPIEEGKTGVRVENLAYGEYAVKVFHDENSNNELDTRIFGIPEERYGFSNNARAILGRPSFEDARFVLDAPAKSITVRVAAYPGQGGGKEAGNEK